MPKINGEQIAEAVTHWTNFRNTFIANRHDVAHGDVRKFMDGTNQIAGKLISALDSNDPGFYESLAEICLTAQALLTHPDVMTS